MRKFFSLLKLQINAQYGFSSALYNFKNDKKAFWKAIGMGLIIFIALVEVIGIYGFLMYQLYKGALTLNTPQIVITMASVAAGLMVLVFGIFYILSALFLAKDTELLASLPIPQGHVFFSKFLLVLLAEYPIAFFLMLPPVIIYGIGQKTGAFYYILAIICTILLPLVPLIISALLSLILMNIVSRSKRRDLITIIGSIVFIVLIFAGQNYLMSRMPNNQQDFMMVILNSSNALIEYMGGAFPPAIWITKILTGTMQETLLNLLYLLLISFGAFAIVYLLASFIFQRGATAQLETGVGTGKTKLTYKKTSQVFTIFKNELLVIIRTPVYALNSLIMIFMAPILLMLPLLGGNLANDPDLQFLYQLIEKGDSKPTLLLIVAGIITAFVLINPAISTTFSREGKNIWILKNIPVKPEIQVFGKFLAGYSISFVGAFFSAVVAMFSFRVDFVTTIMVIILCGAALIPTSAAGILIDLSRPKLTWNNPQEAIKQNFNAVLAMLLGIVIISIFGVIGYFIATLNLNIYIIFGIMTAVILITSYLFLIIIKKTAEGAYAKIEA